MNRSTVSLETRIRPRPEEYRGRRQGFIFDIIRQLLTDGHGRLINSQCRVVVFVFQNHMPPAVGNRPKGYAGSSSDRIQNEANYSQ